MEKVTAYEWGMWYPCDWGGIPMRPLWKDIVAGIFWGLVIPGILLNFAVMYLQVHDETPALQLETEPEETVPQEAVPVCYVDLVLPDGNVQKTEMETYLLGVVLAEMPAHFETEALKSQAVVARTYAIKAKSSGHKHADGDICTKAECCQAYIPEETYIASGGHAEDVDKIRHAVEKTAGLVLTYEGKPIEATYFSCSGGQTEDAVAVWGTDYPYLRSVSSPGEEHATHYTDTEIFSKEAFCDALGIAQNSWKGSLLGTVTYTAGGGIAQMDIGGVSFSGTQLRQKLGLRSTAITMVEMDSSVEITTMGFGHRVGMSQYGADAMASAPY